MKIEIQCKTAHLYRHEDGYVVFDQHTGATQDAKTATEMVDAARELVPEDELAAALVLSNQSRTTREARHILSDYGREHLACVALVIESRISEITGNFFLRVNRPNYPMQLFRDVAEARKWVAGFVGTKRPPQT